MNLSFDVSGDANLFKASICFMQVLRKRHLESILEPEPERAVADILEGPHADPRAKLPIVWSRVGAHGPETHIHILRGLGEGTMGRVFLARDSSTSKVFALKVFKKHHVLASEELENVVGERNFLAESCDNPFVVGLQASFQDESRLYMLLEFCPGGDLAAELSRWSGKMPMGTVMYYAAHLLEGVASLHTMGIIHRDLKPANVLIIHGRIKISDFGSAARVVFPETDIESSDTAQFGTPAYLAPEIITGSPHGFAIDWWCLGIVIFEMIVGEHPFLPQSTLDGLFDMEDMQESICNGEYMLPNNIEPSIRRIIRGLLRTNPDRRYGAAEARKSSFFAGWDWDLVRQLKYQPPDSSLGDVYDFDSKFSPDFANMSFGEEEVRESVDLVYDPDLFSGFELAPTGYASDCLLPNETLMEYGGPECSFSSSDYLCSLLKEPIPRSESSQSISAKPSPQRPHRTNSRHTMPLDSAGPVPPPSLKSQSSPLPHSSRSALETHPRTLFNPSSERSPQNSSLQYVEDVRNPSLL